MTLLAFFLFMWGLAVASGHHIPAKTHRTFAAWVAGLLIIFIALQIKSKHR